MPMGWFDRLKSSLRKQKLEDELDEELRFHLEMKARDHAATGATPEDAREQALCKLGTVARIKEACRDVDTVAWIETAWQDLAYAARTMRKSRGFTAAAVLCLACGIGANTAIFSFVNAFLLRPLAVKDPGRVVMIHRQGGEGGPLASYPEYADWRALNGVFSGLAASTPERFTIGRGVESESVLGEVVTADYFSTLGVTPRIGRAFSPEDDTQAVAVISHALWTRRFAADPGVPGRTIVINRQTVTIVGIAPPTFDGLLAPWTTDIWVTLAAHPEFLRDRTIGSLFMIAARLNKGLTLRQAEAAMNILDSRLQLLYPSPQSRKPGPVIIRHSGALMGSSDTVIALAKMLMAIVGLILLIVCVNVANLLLARALARRREITIRLSLGASRRRLIRQFLVESCLLGLLGAVAGTLLAFISGNLLAGFVPDSISGGFKVSHPIDGRVLTFMLALSMLSVMLYGLLPAVQASRQDLIVALKTQAAPAGRSSRLRAALVVAQIALSLMVLVAAGLFVRSFQLALQTDLGFDAKGLLLAPLDLGEQHYPPERLRAFYHELTGRIAVIAGVQSVSLANTFPLGNNTRSASVFSGDSPPLEVACSTVDGHYFLTMGIPLVRGRNFRPGEPNAIIVNEAMSRRLWVSEDPVGRQIRLTPDGPFQEVIGVVGNGKYRSLDEVKLPFLYRFADSPAEASAYLLVRTAAAAHVSAESIRREIQRANAELPATAVITANQHLAAHLAPARSGATLLGILGLMALGLSIVGVYGMLAQLVAQRTAEIALRIALGATPADVLGVILRQTSILLGAGMALGLGGAVAASRLLKSFLLQVSPTDGVTLIAVCALVALAGLAASFIPARRATRVDPMTALRVD
jgi:predicted permease